MSQAMKFVVAAVLVLRAAGRLQVAVAGPTGKMASHTEEMQGHGALAPSDEAAGHSEEMLPSDEAIPAGVLYGDSRCPCIGFDNIEGETLLELEVNGEKLEVSYPADIGARCEAWDDNRLPECRNSRASWCSQQWCYVDPCNCAIDVLPKVASLYNTEAMYRGKPLFWSYATCGGKDMFTQKVPELGKPKCRCIGFAGLSGTTEIALQDGEKAEFAADLGTSCQAWDQVVHPECKGKEAPAWCKANWCYVDPCDCELPGGVVPKISAYLPEATFTGKNIYYNYETCGNADTFTELYHPLACVNQETEKECGRQSRCAWTGSRCLGRELVEHPLCKKAAKRWKDSGRASCQLSLVATSALLIAAIASGRA